MSSEGQQPGPGDAAINERDSRPLMSSEGQKSGPADAAITERDSRPLMSSEGQQPGPGDAAITERDSRPLMSSEGQQPGPGDAAITERDSRPLMSSEGQQPGPGDAAVTQTDSRPPRGKGQAVGDVYYSSSPVAPDPDAEEYNMAHSRRGMALIFNHANFRHLATRNGTNKDCTALAKALKHLNFEVLEFCDLTSRQLKEKLDEVSNADHTDADCLLIAVLSHGDTGILHAADRPYPVQQLWNPFLGDKCRTLAGKPKIFIIQACRGEQVDKGARVRTETDSAGGGHYTIPAHSDILVAYSTVEGYYSWRNPSEGSWFIQALVEEFKLNGRKRDLQTLLTFVSRRVAVEKMSFVPNDPHMDQKKQASSFMSTLTRLVFFR